jgi:hypothetical protein
MTPRLRLAVVLARSSDGTCAARAQVTGNLEPIGWAKMEALVRAVARCLRCLRWLLLACRRT